jgi:hypothetical protein
MVINKNIYREFEAGWNSLFDKLIGELDALPIVIEVTQAKEKYALLRVCYSTQYTNADYRAIIDRIIEKYTSVSGHTCILCGSTDRVNQRYINDYKVTICDNCYEKEV